MNVTLRQLRAFIGVSEAGHFTRAAEKLGISQSSVSTLVRELEQNLGLRLFDRHTRMLKLTLAGAEILPLARKAVADLDTVILSSSELRTLGRGRVSIAASSLQAALLLPRLIRRFCVEHPGIKVNLHDVSQDEVVAMVRAGEVDFGLGREAGGVPDLVSRVVATDHFVVVVPPDHRLARKPDVTWRDLQDEPMIGPRSGNPVREHLDFALAADGIKLVRAAETSLPLTQLGMVDGGLGVAVVTTAARRLAHGLGLVTRTVTEPVVKQSLVLLLRRDRSLSPAAQRFRDMLLDCRAELEDGERRTSGPVPRQAQRAARAPGRAR
jgi:DNA-binding transcriptional LysR family regulator